MMTNSYTVAINLSECADGKIDAFIAGNGLFCKTYII